MNAPRGIWRSNLGFVLAAAGSAIGVGNLWKFPYITWENDGGAFVLIYLASVAAIGLPIMSAELAIGRNTRMSAIPAMEKLGSGRLGGGAWKWVGLLGMLGAAFILSYVMVIAGWAVAYFQKTLEWGFSAFPGAAHVSFGDFLADSSTQVILTTGFSLITAWIVAKGVGGGIERANKILMPGLFLMLIALLFYVMTLEGFTLAGQFLFSPSFSSLSTQSVLEAMGQAFFSLSLAMGVMITYGSYLNKSVAIPRAAGVVVVMDTLVAILASLILYSIIFTFPEIRENLSGSTTGMLFTTLPVLFFEKLNLGGILGPLFYALVAFAALSSTISLLEVVVSYLVDRFRMPRGRATVLSAVAVYMLSLLVILSLNPSNSLSRFELFGKSESGALHALNGILFRDKEGFMNVLDHLVANWMLPITGLLTTLFVGWILKRNLVLGELSLQSRNGRPPIATSGFLVLIRFVSPLAILYILYNILFAGVDFS